MGSRNVKAWLWASCKQWLDPEPEPDWRRPGAWNSDKEAHQRCDWANYIYRSGVQAVIQHHLTHTTSEMTSKTSCISRGRRADSLRSKWEALHCSCTLRECESTSCFVPGRRYESRETAGETPLQPRSCHQHCAGCLTWSTPSDDWSNVTSFYASVKQVTQIRNSIITLLIITFKSFSECNSHFKEKNKRISHLDWPAFTKMNRWDICTNSIWADPISVSTC